MAVLIHQPTNSRGNYNYNARFYKDYKWLYHFHGNYEMIYVVSGQVTAVIDNRAEKLNAGQFALILPNQLHSLNGEDGSEMWIWVFSAEYVYHFDAGIKNKVGKQSGFHCTPAVHNLVIKYLIEEDTQDIDMRKACFYALCSEFAGQVEMVSREVGEESLYRSIVDYVTERFREPISLSSMATELGYDYHYLSRVFHNLFHMNFCHFVNQYRINYANQLLMQEGRSVTEIAYESGFQSVRSFNDVYKKTTGRTPGGKGR